MKIKAITLELTNNEARYIIGCCCALVPTLVLIGLITIPPLIVFSVIPLVIALSLQISMEEE